MKLQSHQIGFFADCEHAERWIDIHGEEGVYYIFKLTGNGSIYLEKSN